MWDGGFLAFMLLFSGCFDDSVLSPSLLPATPRQMGDAVHRNGAVAATWGPESSLGTYTTSRTKSLVMSRMVSGL